VPDGLDEEDGARLPADGGALVLAGEDIRPALDPPLDDGLGSPGRASVLEGRDGAWTEGA
jgi:hypothetical protein